MALFFVDSASRTCSTTPTAATLIMLFPMMNSAHLLVMDRTPGAGMVTSFYLGGGHQQRRNRESSRCAFLILFNDQISPEVNVKIFFRNQMMLRLKPFFFSAEEKKYLFYSLLTILSFSCSFLCMMFNIMSETYSFSISLLQFLTHFD